MICVDTSVWVAALDDGVGPEARHLAELIEADEVVLPAPVRVELLAVASRKEHGLLQARFSALHQAVPDNATWERVEGWVATAVTAGQRFGVADLLIAASAAEHGARMWSLDTDFARMQKLGFVELYGGP